MALPASRSFPGVAVQQALALGRLRLQTWRPPLSRCSATEADMAFEKWLQANRLPGQPLAPASATAPGTAGARGTSSLQQQQQQHPALRRFHWTEAAAVATCCAERGELRWALEGTSGVLVAHVSGSGADGQPPAARLVLPRVLAGSHPALFFGKGTKQRRDMPPLAVSTEDESQRLLQALCQLAAQEPPQGSGGSRSGGSRSPAFDSAAAAGVFGEPGWNGHAWSSCQQQQQEQRFLGIGSHLLVLLSADSAALALFSEGELTRHRVLTGYTVRRQQGKAQATYERQGGGARSVGGSIRARETRRLFQSAAASLADWAPCVAGCNLLFRSGTVRVWNELYASSNPPPPVDRQDPRWQPAGMSVRRPRLADVQRVYAALSYGSLAGIEVEAES